MLSSISASFDLMRVALSFFDFISPRFLLLASSDGLRHDVIVVYALERIELLYGLVGFVVQESPVIAVQDLSLENLYPDVHRHLLEDLDVVDIVEELRENIEPELRCTVNFIIVVLCLLTI